MGIQPEGRTMTDSVTIDALQHAATQLEELLRSELNKPDLEVWPEGTSLVIEWSGWPRSWEVIRRRVPSAYQHLVEPRRRH